MHLRRIDIKVGRNKGRAFLYRGGTQSHPTIENMWNGRIVGAITEPGHCFHAHGGRSTRNPIPLFENMGYSPAGKRP